MRLGRLARTLDAQARKPEALRDLVRAAHASDDPARIATVAAERLAEWLPLAGWAVLRNDWSGLPSALAVHDLAAAHSTAAQAVARLVFRAQGAWFAPRLAAVVPGAPDVAALGFPLWCRDECHAAVVGLDAAPADTIERLPVQLLRRLDRALEPVAFALDVSLRLQRAEALAVTDDLTQLYNARFLGQVLGREAKRAKRAGRPLSVLFVDLDGFKAVNDRWGHLAGSRALRETAQVLQRTARESDIVARFGGDEFALVLPETTARGARVLAGRIRERVASHAFLADDGLDVRLTVSVGIATLPGSATTAEGLLSAADHAMYWVKERGKDGIRSAGRAAGRRARAGTRLRSVER